VEIRQLCEGCTHDIRKCHVNVTAVSGGGEHDTLLSTAPRKTTYDVVMKMCFG